MEKDARAAFAQNLTALINASGASARAWARERRLNEKAVQRAKANAINCSLDFVSEVARATGCQPWQLLVPNFDPKAKPQLALSPADKEALEVARRTAVDLVEKLGVGTAK